MRYIELNKLSAQLALAGALVLGACEDDTQDGQKTAGRAGNSATAADSGAGKTEADGGSRAHPDTTDKQGHVYALLSLVLGDDATTSYIELTDSLDFQPSLDKAREFSGWASMAAVDGKLLVTNGDAPKISSFAVDDLKWKEGATLSFANTGVSGVDFAQIWMLDKNTAYLSLDTTSRVVFDPAALTLGEILDDTNLEVKRKDGMELGLSWHRQARLRDIERVTIPYSYYKEFTIPGPSILATYDPTTHKEAKLTEVECEGLEVESHDEDGNTYYSAWYSWQVGFLYKKAEATCVVRINKDGSVADGWPKNFLDLTGGRPVAAWQYLKDGKAVATVLHQDEGVAPTGDFNADLELGPYYTWIFDLEKNEAHKLDGIRQSGWGFQLTQIDGHFFLLVTNVEWTSTTAYELDVDSGSVKTAFTTDGWVYDWLRVK